MWARVEHLKAGVTLQKWQGAQLRGEGYCMQCKAEAYATVSQISEPRTEPFDLIVPSKAGLIKIMNFVFLQFTTFLNPIVATFFPDPV